MTAQKTAARETTNALARLSCLKEAETTATQAIAIYT